METTTNEVISEQSGQTLQLKRALLPIEKYAAREGVSEGIVEECGKLGIVQIRKYKDKVFVVDIPLSPYSVFTKPGAVETNEPYDDEIQDSEFEDVFNCGEVADNTAASEHYPQTPETTTASTQFSDETVFAEKISELVQKVIPDETEAGDESSQSGKWPRNLFSILPLRLTNLRKLFQLPKNVFHKIWPTADEPVENTNEEIERAEIKTELARIIQVEEPESADEPVQSGRWSIKAKKISELIKRIFYRIWSAEDELTEDTKEQVRQDENVPEQVQMVPSESLEIIEEPTAAVNQDRQTEDSPEPIQTPDLQELKIIDETDSPQIIHPDVPESTCRPAQPDVVGPPGLISRFSAKWKPATILRLICKMGTLVATSAINVFQLLKEIFLKAPKTEDKPIEAIGDETVEAERFLEFKQIPQDYGFQFGVLSTHARAKRVWQVVAIFSLTFLFIAVLSALWLYMDRKIQFDRLDQYGASIQKIYDDSMQANRQVETLQNELAGARAEIERLKSELGSSRAEVKTVRSELVAARQSIETIQQRNAEAVERLDDQIQRLTNRLPGVMESHQTPPGNKF